MTLADDIAYIRQLADVEEALTTENRERIIAKVYGLYLNRRTPSDLDAAIARGTIDRDNALTLYSERVDVRDDPVTGVRHLHDVAEQQFTDLQTFLAAKRAELAVLEENEPPPTGQSDELDATRHVALQEGVTIPYP